MLIVDPDDPAAPRPYGYDETAAQRQADADVVLLPAVEALDVADARALESWSASHGYNFGRQSIRQWMRTAVDRELLVEEDGHVKLAPPQRAARDVDEIG